MPGEWPEARGRGQEHEVNLVDHVFICVKPGILTILGHVDPRADRRLLECGEVILEPIREGVGHGDELGIGVGGEGLLGGAAASTAAADQAELDRAAGGGMNQWDGQAGRCHRGRRALEKIATRGGRGCGRGRGGGTRRLGSVCHGGNSGWKEQYWWISSGLTHFNGVSL